LPNALVSVDGFHLVQLANLMLTRVRQRLVRDREQRRGRLVDPAWANRMLLLRGYSAAPPDVQRQPIDQAEHHGQLRIAAYEIAT